MGCCNSYDDKRRKKRLEVNECHVDDCLVKLICADVCFEETNGLVCPASANLNAKSGLAYSIIQRAGLSVQADLTEFGEFPVGEVLVTDGGNLKCEKILHTSLPSYSGGQTDERSLLMETFQLIFERADHLSLEVLVFPLLPSGAFSFPIEMWADVLFESVEMHRKSGVKIVKVVNDDLIVVKSFEMQMIKFLSQKLKLKTPST